MPSEAKQLVGEILRFAQDDGRAACASNTGGFM